LGLRQRFAKGFGRPALGLVFLVLAGASPAGADRGFDFDRLADAVAQARALERLNSLIVARNGEIAVAESFRGLGLDAPVNIKSVSKSVIAALVGIAIDRDILAGPDQAIGAVLGDRNPADADPRVREITIGNLLSMQAGLERTSGRNYGRWVQSSNWVAHVLSRPFVDVPGGGMLYSTGSSHLLSAILTRASGRSTLDLARDWLGGPLGIDIPGWDRDPQGIYFGGNNMALSPRALLQFGELYRRGGEVDGRRILPEAWVQTSWTPRTRSVFSGDGYGYGWFLRDVGGGRVAAYARGFGGQYVIVIPSLAMTIVIISDTATRLRVDGYGDALWSMVEDKLIPAALAHEG
jgi:CubicO group peptidase (beta-lactamase class C family)